MAKRIHYQLSSQKFYRTMKYEQIFIWQEQIHVVTLFKIKYIFVDYRLSLL